MRALRTSAVRFWWLAVSAHSRQITDLSQNSLKPMIRIGLSPMRRAPSARHSHVCDEVIRTEASFVAYCSRHPGDEKEVNEDGVMPSVEHSSMWSKDCQHYACHPVPTFLPSYDVNDRTDALYEFDGSTGSYFVQTDQQFQYCD